MRYTPQVIVENDMVFTIPLYQRLFEWSKDNVMQLLDDLNSAFEKYKKLDAAMDDDNSDYYIGMLTSTTARNDEKRMYLVDGQQRFTVMTLIGCVMQHFAHDLWHSFLLNDGKPRLSFVSRKSDEMYLQKLIQEDFKYDGNYSANARAISLSNGNLNYEPCLNAYQSVK